MKSPRTFRNASILLMLLAWFLAFNLMSCNARPDQLNTEIKPATRTTLVPSATQHTTHTPTQPATHTPTQAPTLTATLVPTATIPEQTTLQIMQKEKIYLGDRLIFDLVAEDLGCFGIGPISYSPTEQHFLVIVECFEADNEAYLFNADGTGKTRITGPYDYLNYLNYEWADDGLSFTYLRINSCCLSASQIPADAPPPGWVRYDLASGTKELVNTPLTPESYFMVINVASDDVLNVRSGAGVEYPIVGTIPYNGTDIQVTGPTMVVGESSWAPILYEGFSGWVNLRFLAAQPQP